jgi:hypothetical protein
VKPVDAETEQMIKDCLRYEPETGLLYWKHHWSKSQLIGTKVTSKFTSGYYRVKINGRSFRQHNISWFLHYGKWPAGVIDHRDGDRSNLRIENLRDTDTFGNARNKASASNTGFKGVSVKKNGRYSATITPNSEYQHLGTFNSAEEAARAYDAAALQHFGEFARLNFPGEISA